MTLLTPSEEREDLFDRSSRALGAEMRRLARAVVASHQGEGNAQLHRETERFQRIAAGIVEYGMILGERRTLLTANRVRSMGLARKREPILCEVPKVPFREAIEDFKSRDPKLAGSAAEVRHLYATEKAFAMAKSTSQVLTSRVSRMITQALTEGGTVDDLAERIMKVGQAAGDDFSQGYSEMVYRTNIMTAYSDGQKAMAADPDVKEVIPAFRFSPVGDVDTRPGHAALDGLIAATDSWVWDLYTPPLWYGCRCAIDFVDVYDLREMGLVLDNGTVGILYPSGWEAREMDQLFAYGA